MKIRFIFLGKKKSSVITQLVEQYNKRINFFVKSEIIYFYEKNNNKLESKLENLFNKKNFIICLDESGKEINSKSFSEFLEFNINCFDTICFLVGDSNGFNNTILDKSNYVMSLSKMTLTHLFARLLIVEQVYRSLTITNNHPYHNE